MDVLEILNSNPIPMGTVVVSLVTLALVLAKIVDKLMLKFLKTKQKVLSEEEYERIKAIENKIKIIHAKIEDKPTLTDEQNNMLKDILDLHSKTDVDGIPLHYFPRSFIETQKDIVEVLSEISSHQEKTTYLLESLIKKIDRLEDKISNCQFRNKE
jgi:uncharacterized membrane-anchored protein YitT (DUF2179 family)